MYTNTYTYKCYILTYIYVKSPETLNDVYAHIKIPYASMCMYVCTCVRVCAHLHRPVSSSTLTAAHTHRQTHIHYIYILHIYTE